MRDVGIETKVNSLLPLKTELPSKMMLVGIDTDEIRQSLNAESARELMSVEMKMTPLQHIVDGVVLSTQPVVAE